MEVFTWALTGSAPGHGFHGIATTIAWFSWGAKEQLLLLPGFHVGKKQPRFFRFCHLAVVLARRASPDGRPPLIA